MRHKPELRFSQVYRISVTGDADIARQRKRAIFRIGAIVVFATLVGCTSLQQIPEPAPVPEPDTSSAAPSVAVPAPPPQPPPEPQPERNRIAILLSDDVPTYAAIADQITQRGRQNDYKTLNLDRDPEISASMLAEIKQFDPDKIVAIGLLAAKAGQKFLDTPMVFCQVFNYQDHDLISPKSKGVKFLPPFSLQLEIWKELSPDLQIVGLIVGPGQEELVAEIRKAAEQYQVELLARTVQSDKEALYAFKRLTSQIQGFWLLPDNRVLSPTVLREIISYGRKHGNQTVVFSPQLLSLGADISFASSDADVADAVLKVLGGAAGKNSLFGPSMTPLTTLRAEINPDVSDDLRSRASAKLAQYLDEK
jgi:ABC-type uncharacterized transport system substrate-binding protein